MSSKKRSPKSLPPRAAWAGVNPATAIRRPAATAAAGAIASAAPAASRTSSRPRSQASSPAPSRIRPGSRPGLLSLLGVHGVDELEPIVLAALATEAPLLLIGPHGTAKSRLLLRLGEALGLKARHYNASLLNFDDLVGYPLPDESGGLRFVETPASVWGAEAVFLDEISRCRPDMQNRLYSLIHERRVQGLDIASLRHRWAAMNPPPALDEGLDDAEDELEYAGSEPLDPALADRFPFVAVMPSWGAFDERSREAIIRLNEEPVDAGAASELRRAVQLLRDELPSLEKALGPALSEWCQTLVPLLGSMGLPLSPRRAGMLYRNALAVHAARAQRECSDAPGESAWLSLRCGLPHRAEGRRIDELKLFAAHREAWATAGLDRLDPRRQLLRIVEPVKRAVHALQLGSLGVAELSAHVADALAAAGPGGRHALAAHLIETGDAARLAAHVGEQAAELYALAMVGQSVAENMKAGSPRHRAWAGLLAALGDGDDSRDHLMLTNVAMGLFAAGEISDTETAWRVVTNWTQVRACCAGEAAA